MERDEQKVEKKVQKKRKRKDMEPENKWKVRTKGR